MGTEMKGVCVVCGKEAELIEYDKTDMFRPYDGYCNECKDKSFKLQMEQLDYKISSFKGIIDWIKQCNRERSQK
jgi:hypothetical protein